MKVTSSFFSVSSSGVDRISFEYSARASFFVANPLRYFCICFPVTGCFPKFDRQEYFTDAFELFDYLLETWEKIYLFEMEKIYGSTEMSEEEIREILPEEGRKEMEKIRDGYIMQYEKCRINC